MAKHIARLAVLTALALILSYVESLLALVMPVPGAKLGLANLVTLVALYLFGWKDALTISCLRVLLGGFLFGSGFSILYALAGALLALLGMTLLKKLRFHAVTVSIAGGVLHNLAQLGVAAIITRTPALMLSYLPLLLALGVLTGLVIGLLGTALIKRLQVILAQ